MPKNFSEGSFVDEPDVEQWELKQEAENYFEATLSDGKTVSMDRVFNGKIFRYRVLEILTHLT